MLNTKLSLFFMLCPGHIRCGFLGVCQLCARRNGVRDAGLSGRTWQ